MGYELRRWLADRLPPELSSGERLVALEIADQANDTTRLAYGRGLLEVVARRTGFSSTKQVRKVLTKLAAKNIELRVPLTGKDGRPLVGKDGRLVYAREGQESTYRIPTMAECPALQEPPPSAEPGTPPSGPPSGSPRNGDGPPTPSAGDPGGSPRSGGSPSSGHPSGSPRNRDGAGSSGRGHPCGSPRNCANTDTTGTASVADNTEGPRPGPGGPPPGSSRAPAGDHEGPRWGAPSPHIPSESPQEESQVLAVGELTDRNARACVKAPSAQPKDNSFTSRTLIAHIPRYRHTQTWVRRRLASLARAALDRGLGVDAILRYAHMVIAERSYPDHQHIPEFRAALARLGRDVALGDVCAAHGTPECLACADDRPWTDADQADLEAALARLGVTPNTHDATEQGGAL